MNMLYFHSIDCTETLDVDVISSESEAYMDRDRSNATRFGVRIVGWAISQNNKALPRRLPFTALLKDTHAFEYTNGAKVLYFRR